MTGYAQEEAPAFQAEDFFRLIRARQTMILRIAAAVVLAAILIALALPTIYTSSAVVMLDPRKNNVTDPSQVLAQVEGDPASLQNQIQLLTSRGLAEKVIVRLKLDEDPEFNPAIAPPGIGQLMADLKAIFNPRNWFGDGVAGVRPRDRILDNFAKHVSAGANGL
ncbi:MAG: Wzz/FepE/Etk N-terminal domain-containing protein, partial [Rhizomicrobium sp.]